MRNGCIDLVNPFLMLNISPEDNIPPDVSTFPDDVTVTVPFGVTSSPVSWTEPTSTDNSGTSFQSPSQPSGSSFPVGTTPVTYTFTDPSGNNRQQTLQVTVIMLRKFPYKTSFSFNRLPKFIK